MSKRLFDLIVASVALCVLAPLLLLLALVVRLDTPGPALFRQVRVGRYGVPFEIFKFRTMTVAPPGAAGLLISVAGDSRITRSGSWLRAAKLDELPQLLNVVRGEMSLVGPRPEVPRYVAHYPDSVRDEVLSVRPGITDEASIRFSRENDMLAGATDPERVYVEEILPIKLAIYREYIQTRSFCGDFRIIIRTLLAVRSRPES